MEKRETLTFDPNTPRPITFAYDGGKEFTSQFDGRVKTMYTLQNNQVLYADADLAVKINFCEPKRGDTLWVTRVVQRKGWRNGKLQRMTSWQVSRQEPGVVQRRNEFPSDSPKIPSAVQETGIEETELERQMRETVEIRQRAQTNTQARQNLARQPAPAPAPLPTQGALAVQPDRKPPQVETQTRPQTQIEAALKTVMAACKSATAYAREIDYQAPPFTSDDIAKMAMTLIIGKQRETGR